MVGIWQIVGVKNLKKTKIKYKWKDVGMLRVTIKNNQYAVLRYFPSKSVIKKTLEGFVKQK